MNPLLGNHVHGPTAWKSWRRQLLYSIHSSRVDSVRLGRDDGRRDRPSSRYEEENLERDRKRSEFERVLHWARQLCRDLGRG